MIADDGSVFLYAFDLIELNGDDLRREPLEVRKATLASVVAKAAPGVRLNEHIEVDGPTVFVHVCKIGLEGIESKRKDSRYTSGRSTDWLKSKNPASEAAVRREREEDWGIEGDGDRDRRQKPAAEVRKILGVIRHNAVSQKIGIRCARSNLDCAG
jgi:bifunctional non-homologous end joining protein LigD